MGTAPLMQWNQRDAKVCGWAVKGEPRKVCPWAQIYCLKCAQVARAGAFGRRGAGQENSVPMGTESGGQHQALSTPAVQRLLAGLWPMKKSGAGLAGGEAGWALQP